MLKPVSYSIPFLRTIKKQLSFAILLSFIIVFFVYNTEFLLYSINELFSYKVKISYKPKNVKFPANACNLFNENFNQTKFNITGKLFPKFLPLYHNKSLNFDCMNQNNEPKVILMWNDYFGAPLFGAGRFIYEASPGCPVNNCLLTNDRTKLGDSDMVLFHMRNPREPLPSFRYEHQKWVFMLYESQTHSGYFRKYNSFFNMSSTFKSNSNFTSVYYGDSKIYWEENKDFNEKKDYSAGKTGFAAAIISNCWLGGNRLKLIKKLQKYIPVKIYGACGQKCPSVYENGTKAHCKAIIASKFKFYFAFENSLCQDYVTEKFFKMLPYDIIPVVYGGGNYEHYVPKEAYINVRDFESIPMLVEYLMHLDKDVNAYNSYFKWKKYVTFRDHPYFLSLCEMCIQLNIDAYQAEKRSEIADLSQSWNRMRDCYRMEISIAEELIWKNYI